MTLIVLVAVIFAGILLWAFYSESVPPRPRFRPRRLELPLTASDIRSHDAPIVLAGYDPRWVDDHLKQVAVIHESLGGHPTVPQQGELSDDGGVSPWSPDATDTAPRSVLDD